MKKIYSIVVLSLLLGTVYTTTAQQITINNPVICSGGISYFSIPPFPLPPSSNIESYTFYIAGDTLTTTENEYSTQLNPGIYEASAKIVLSNGSNLSTNIITFGVVNPPVANFSFVSGNTICNSDSALCVNSTSIQGDLPITRLQWDWGDGFYLDSGATAVCHHYLLTGNTYLSLRVSDSIGCFSDTSYLVIVKEPITPQLSWMGVPSCGTSSYIYFNTYHKAVHSYTWDFGDGQTYTATRPFSTVQEHHIDSITHVYTTDGIFHPALSITDTNGCSVTQSQNYIEPLPFPTNIVSNGHIISSHLNASGPDEQTFCYDGQYVYFSPPSDSQFSFSQYWPGAVWDFGDPASMQENMSYDAQPYHRFAFEGQHIVKLDLSNTFPNCVFYDTLELVGPTARIEYPNIGVTIANEQKYQAKGTDTVDFVNTTINYGVSNKISFVWDFDDQFAPSCTSYSIPKPGALLPFNSAMEQYQNSDHYYIRNGSTYSGKMNCRWSLDSLPRHKYTNWDSVYSWYVSGKTFPASWGLAPIPANQSISIDPNSNLLDPFMLAQGKNIMLMPGTLSTPNSSYSYTAPDGSVVSHNGADIIPNSSQTFHQFLFYNTVMHNYNVHLSAADSLGTGCSSDSYVMLSHGTPSPYKISISGKECAGSYPTGVVYFDFWNANNTVVLINFDSLADRKDGTPCDIDGFVGYQGGFTPGGLNFPPFFSAPNFTPPTIWQAGSGKRIAYHYGPNAPGNRPAPADNINGNITVGVIIGSGCANPPYCTEAEVYSDTMWIHNALQIKNLNPQFDIQQEGQLFSKGKNITVIPQEAYQPSIKHDTWIWGDGSVTIDSFWYASDLNLPETISNGFFVNGKRRVRYQFSIDESSDLTLTDSLPFPNGLPGVGIQTDTINQNQCINNPATWYLMKDSAMLLFPITHSLQKSSYEMSGDLNNPQINQVIHLTGNTHSCIQIASKNTTVGIIDSIVMGNKSAFCNNETVSVTGYARYFRCDNQITDMFFNPNYSCASGIYYNPPYDILNFDTIDFWNRNKNQSANIKYTYLNPTTFKQDTVYYEKMFWNFGDGSPVLNGLNVSHQYQTAGTFTIRMITRDSVGGWDTCTQQVVVGAPVAKIVLPTDPFPPHNPKTVFSCIEDIHLTDSSYNVNGMGANYWWFGDGRDTIDWQLKNAKETTHHYSSNGSFRIKLVTESAGGCKDTDYADIYISGPRPYYRMISGNTGCYPFTVKLVNNADAKRSKFPSDSFTTVSYFDFGDQSAQVPAMRHDTLEHTYTSPGQYFITAYGSDAPVGASNTCPLVVFPDGNMDTLIYITVSDNATNGIVGESTAATSETQPYSVARTTYATYSWSVVGGTILSGQTSHTATIEWGTTDGNYRLVCTKKNRDCTTSDTLMVMVGSPTGIEESSQNQNRFVIYPNPARNNFTLKWNKPVNEKLQVQLYDLVGKTYLKETILPGAPDEHTFNLHDLKPGIYFIGIQSESRNYTYKLLVE